MHRLKALLGGIALVAVLVGGFVATEIDFGGEGTLISRLPVAGPTLDALLPRGPGGTGPILVTGRQSERCDDLFAASAEARADLVRPTVAAARETGATATEDQLVLILTVACQMQPGSSSIDEALVALSEAAKNGDPTQPICEAYRRDGSAIVDVLIEDQEAVDALGREVSVGNDPRQTFPALVRARSGLTNRVRALEELVLETHAARTLRDALAEINNRERVSHERWLGGAPDADTWMDGPAEDGASRWFAENEDLLKRVEVAQANPDLSVLPPGTGCNVDDILRP